MEVVQGAWPVLYFVKAFFDAWRRFRSCPSPKSWPYPKHTSTAFHNPYKKVLSLCYKRGNFLQLSQSSL